MKKIAALVNFISIALLVSAGGAHAQDPGNGVKVPLDHWAYQVLERADPVPPPVRIHYGYAPRDPDAGMTRREFARRITEWIDGLPPPEKIAGSPLPFQARLYYLRRLVREFAPELETLGRSLPQLNARLATPVPFSDVPKDHWAASSVQRLQEAGILAGYPRLNGEF